MIRAPIDQKINARVEWSGSFYVSIDRYLQEVNLEKALKVRFPNDRIEWVSRLLSEILEKGCVSYREIDLPEEEKEETILSAFADKLLIPTKSGKMAAWRDRSLSLEPDECYRVPNIAAAIARYAEESGQWNPGNAIFRYFARNGNRRATEWQMIFRSLRGKARNNKVTPYTFRQSVMELGLVTGINQVMIDFLSADIISPCLSRAIPSGHIEFEIHPCL